MALSFGRAREELEQLSLLDDRERIARDLHDTVIQSLFAIGLRLEAAVGIVRPPEIQERLHTVVTEIDDVIRNIRLTIFTLENPALPSRGARDRIVEVIEESANHIGFMPRLTTSGPVDTVVSDELEAQLLPTLRESLSNVARHARATDVAVILEVSDEVVLKVQDNGVGLVASGAHSAPGSGGNGLRNMDRRARSLGGVLRVTTADPHGTVVEWRVPTVQAPETFTTSEAGTAQTNHARPA